MYMYVETYQPASRLEYINYTLTALKGWTPNEVEKSYGN